MIDIILIREDFDKTVANLERRGVKKKDIALVRNLDNDWRSLVREVDDLRGQQNQASQTMAKASPKKKKKLIKDLKKVSDQLKAREKKRVKITEQLKQAQRQLPNLLRDDVPDGDEADFELIRLVPENISPPSFRQKNYFELADPSLIDLSRAAKVSGSRFVYIKGNLARLQIALVSYVFDQLAKDDFIPIIPPVLINHDAMDNMGYLDQHADEVYQTKDNLYLTGTSEQSIGPLHADEILKLADLPLRYVGYSSCFRREAGSHGKDVRGLMRLHQFEKIEMFSFTTADQSDHEHIFLLGQQEKIMQALELPYRVINLAAHELGPSCAKTIDIETWMPSEERYRETHSASNTTDYQARRLNIRIKQKQGTAKAHLLNATAIAMSRTFIALIENHQQPDGSINIPNALHPYLPFTSIPPQF